MAVYLIADIEVTDPAGFEEYKALVPALIAAHGGRYIARGGASQVLEGNWHPRRTAVILFPSRAAFDAFWNAPDYQPLRALRERSARTNLVLIEGLEGNDIDTLYGLEPVITTGTADGIDDLAPFAEVDCPWCGEAVAVQLDLSEGSYSTIDDCQVCCAPIALGVHVDDDGQLTGIDAARADR